MSSSMIVSTLFGADGGGEGPSTATHHIAQEKR
jgi:hypothetical protein